MQDQSIVKLFLGLGGVEAAQDGHSSMECHMHTLSCMIKMEVRRGSCILDLGIRLLPSLLT